MLKLKTTEIPHGARRLYIKLYCERKGGKTNENLIAAAQSWLSLSATKKQHFRDTISTKSAIIVAQRIIKTKPYLKGKNPLIRIKRKRNRGEISQSDGASSNNLITTVNDCMDCDNDQTSIPLVEENNSILDKEAASEIFLELDKPVGQTQDRTTHKEKVTNQNIEDCTLEEAQGDQKDQHKTLSIHEDDTNSLKEHSIRSDENMPLPEPILPIIRTGRDLFELLKTRNGHGDKTYKTLTRREKTSYANAASTIKKDYVKNYKQYLESLPAKQLYEHFMKVSVPE